MKIPPLTSAAASAAQHALAACLAATLLMHGRQLPATVAAAPPSSEAQVTLRRGVKAATDGLLPTADQLLTTSITEWKQTGQPADEVAALLKTRAEVREQQGRLSDALADLDEAVPQMRSPADAQRAYAQRARVNAQLRRWQPAEADLSAAIDRLDDLDALEATNPYLYADRSATRARLGAYAGAAEDAERAAADFKAIGDKVRRLTATADAALALYGAGDVSAATEKMRYVIANVKSAATNNPDDIGLLQDLSRKEAELHLALAAHLFASSLDGGGGDGGGAKAARAEAEAQWQTGCIRLEGFVADAAERQREEAALRAAEQQRAEAQGKDGAPLKASSVAGANYNNDGGLAARIAGLESDSPYLTQRPQQSWFFYQLGEGGARRIDAGVPLAEADPTLSCGRFREAGWVQANRPAWPPRLAESVARYAEAVPQQPIVMPSKKAPPPKDCVVLLPPAALMQGRSGIGDAQPCF